MRVRTFLLYLLGKADTIREITCDRRYLWIGLMFVFSASFAREYDGTDLLASPWMLTVPLLASLIASFVLYWMVITAVFFGKVECRQGPRSYRTFLTCFWMTAPIAWLYAVPVERFLDPLDAIRANFLALGIVATCRVLLTARVISVLSGRGYFSALSVVLFYANVVVGFLLLLNFLLHLDFAETVAAGMAGVLMYTSPENELILQIMKVIYYVWIISFPILLILSVIQVWQTRNGHVPTTIPETPPHQRGFLPPPAVGSLVVWAGILPFTQPPLQRRTEIETLYAEARRQDPRENKRRFAVMLEKLSQYTPEEFPPYWDPPPRLRYATLQNLFALMQEIVDHSPSPWVREAYMRKFHLALDYLAKQRPDIIEGYAPELKYLFTHLPDGPTIKANFLQGVEENLSKETNEEWLKAQRKRLREAFPEGE